METKRYYAWIVVGVCLAMFAMTIAQQDKPVTDICLGCICEAISGCNQTNFCQGGVCGLFRITWPYWADGGKLTINNEPAESETAYANCVNDPYCAANTIQNYMIKYGQDCNKDGAINCWDYAAIHKLGGYGCSGELSHKYVTDLDLCLKSYKAN
ncbi:lysozyme-like [Haematobia irritans]|uniref:lysozyme-like n=1 Tax=Haematobia irritans TaxID=7368 RepID=UPI003F50849A